MLPMPPPLETSDRIDPPPRDTVLASCLFDSPLGNCGIAWSGALAGIAASSFLLAGMASTAHLPGFPQRPGYQSTVVWLVTAGFSFALGQLGGSRPIRLAALSFLGLATVKLVAWDITDLVGRIIACAVAAAAFLGIAWAYARRPGTTAEGKGGID